MNDRLTKEQLEEDQRSAKEARKLTAQYYNDLDAAISRRADYSATRAAEWMAHDAFRLIRTKLGDEAARDFFANYGPKPKRQFQEERKYQLAIQYGMSRFNTCETKLTVEERRISGSS